MSYFWGREPFIGNILLQCTESQPTTMHIHIK